MLVIKQKFIYRQDLRDNPTIAYLFGDNLHQKGYGGQAKEMRGEPNAIGIPTKIKPTNDADAFFTDDKFEQNTWAIDAAFAKLTWSYHAIVIPSDGIGTGLARLQEKAPKTFAYLQEKLDALTFVNYYSSPAPTGS